MYIPEIPDNSLKKQIEDIVTWSRKLCDDYTFEFAQPLSDVDIQMIKEMCRINIPDSYKEWLEFTSSAEICSSIAQFYDIREVIGNPELEIDDIVVIGSIIGDGEAICLLKTTGQLFTDNNGELYEYENFGEILTGIIELLEMRA